MRLCRGSWLVYKGSTWDGLEQRVALCWICDWINLESGGDFGMSSARDTRVYHGCWEI